MDAVVPELPAPEWEESAPPLDCVPKIILAPAQFLIGLFQKGLGRAYEVKLHRVAETLAGHAGFILVLQDPHFGVIAGAGRLAMLKMPLHVAIGDPVGFLKK